jgi:hypothetical protein
MAVRLWKGPIPGLRAIKPRQNASKRKGRRKQSREIATEADDEARQSKRSAYQDSPDKDRPTVGGENEPEVASD